MSKFANLPDLPDDICNIVVNLHTVHYSSHKEKLKKVLNDLMKKLRCIDCDTSIGYYTNYPQCYNCYWNNKNEYEGCKYCGNELDDNNNGLCSFKCYRAYNNYDDNSEDECDEYNEWKNCETCDRRMTYYNANGLCERCEPRNTKR
jgi:hypothetical protein